MVCGARLTEHSKSRWKDCLRFGHCVFPYGFVEPGELGVQVTMTICLMYILCPKSFEEI